MDKKKLFNKFLKKIKDNNTDLGKKLKDKLTKIKNKKNKDSKGKGLSDDVNLDVKGKLRIEKIDKDGNVIDTHEEDNLVVDQAYYMLLMNLANEEPLDLYLNPIIKDKYLPWESDLQHISGSPEEGEHFEWEIGLKRRPIYRSYNRVSSDRRNSHSIYYNARGMNDFPTSAGGDTPHTLSEVYMMPKKINVNIPNFISLGISKKRYVNNDDSALTHSFYWDYELDDKYKSGIASKCEKTGETITFYTDADEMNPDEMTIYYTGHTRGKEAKVYANGEEVTTFSTYISKNEADEVEYSKEANISLKNYNPDEDGRFEIVIEVDDAEVEGLQGEGLFIFEGMEIEGYNRGTTSLAEEVPEYEDTVDVPDYYNTESEPPYQFMIDLRGTDGIKTETVEVFVNGEELQKVDGIPTPESKEFTVEENGKVVLGFEARDVAVTYETKEEFNTEYKRGLIERPHKAEDIDYKTDTNAKEYPIYNFEKKKIVFETIFGEGNPNYPIEIKEAALVNAPLKQNTMDINESGKFFEEKIFSITDVPGIRKSQHDRIKIIWEIRFTNEN